jgi:endonuclease YncB( thermonuclease family)
MDIPDLSSLPGWLPLGLLLAAIALFKFSTLQMRWPLRLWAWVGGAGALCSAAAVSLASRENYGVWRAVGDVAQHWRDPSQSLAWQAISRNWSTLPASLSPVTDFAILVVALLGIGALIAFTPGQRWERFTRGALIGVISGVIGALLTVLVMALGFGGESHRAVLNGDPSEVTVLDGDTLMIGQTSIRLWGIDAPELGQTCGASAACGEEAKAALDAIVAQGLVECHSRTTRSGRRVESFGRPLMQCFVRKGDERSDIADHMIDNGFAAAYRDRRRGPVESAYAQREGAFRLGCTLRPDTWRRNDAARRAWEDEGLLPADAQDTIGCAR